MPQRRVEAWAGRIRGPSRRRSAAMRRASASASGSAAHLLEPDLKEGVRRLARPAFDLADRSGASATRSKTRDSSAPASARRSRARRSSSLRARSALHLETGKRTDRLRARSPARHRRGHGVRGRAEADLDRRAHARPVRARAGRSSSCSGRWSSACSRRGRPAPRAADVSRRRPGGARDEAEAGREPSAALLDSIEELDVPAVGRVGCGRAPRVLRVCSGRGIEGRCRSRSSTVSGVLARFVPEWADVRCRPQRDPYHRFTVDAHLTSSLRAMSTDARGRGLRRRPVQAEALKQVPDRRRAPPGRAPARYREERGGRSRAGRRAVVGVDPRSDGRRAASSRSRRRSWSSTTCAARHGHAARPLRRGPRPRRRRRGRLARSVSPRSTSWPKPTRRRRGPRRGRRGGEP